MNIKLSNSVLKQAFKDFFPSRTPSSYRRRSVTAQKPSALLIKKAK